MIRPRIGEIDIFGSQWGLVDLGRVKIKFETLMPGSRLRYLEAPQDIPAIIRYLSAQI